MFTRAPSSTQHYDEIDSAFDDPADSDALLLEEVTSDHSTVLELGEPPLRPENQERAINLPGGYDFEPQINDGNVGRQQREIRNERLSNRFIRPISLAERLLPTTLLNRFGLAPSDSTEVDHLLFDQDQEFESNSTSYPPRSTASHVPLPSRPPSFPPPPTVRNARVFGGGQGNDGVFANLSAKPDSIQNGNGGADYVGGEDGAGGDKDEVLPSYESAAVDSTPAYWETTILTPGIVGPDDICVDGLPVGNLFGFAWNLLVSMSFQFVGFLLTYLLHTTHAAKNGSRAGLGITLMQLGFYLKQRIDHPELLDGAPGDATGLDGAAGLNPSVTSTELTSWSWWGGTTKDPAALSDLATSTLSAIGSLPTQVSNALSSSLAASDPDSILSTATDAIKPTLGNINGEDIMRMSSTANEWMAFALVTTGAFLFIGGCLNYYRAVRWARAVQSNMNHSGDEEGRVIA